MCQLHIKPEAEIGQCWSTHKADVLGSVSVRGLWFKMKSYRNMTIFAYSNQIMTHKEVSSICLLIRKHWKKSDYYFWKIKSKFLDKGWNALHCLFPRCVQRYPRNTISFPPTGIQPEAEDYNTSTGLSTLRGRYRGSENLLMKVSCP